VPEKTNGWEQHKKEVHFSVEQKQEEQEMLKKSWNALLALVMITSLVLVACEPTEVEVTRVVKETVVETIIETVIETVEETVMVEGTPVVQEVTRVVEVEKEVVVTATPEPEPTATPPLSDEPVFGGTLNIAWRRTSGMPWDLQTSSENVSRDVLLSVVDTLVAFGEDYSIVPSLAESWEVSADGLTYTFYLHEGITFHDGSDFTSEDVVASLDRYLEVGGRKAAVDELTESFEAVDDYTVVINIASPVVSFIDALATPGFCIAIYPKEIIEGRGDDLTAEEIVGTGPYRIVEWVQGEIVHLVRFDEYQPLPGERDGAGGAKIAYFDEINFHTVPEFGAELAGLQIGEYDIIWDSDYGSAGIVNADPNLKIVWNNHNGIIMGHFASGHAWMDLKFRQAVQAGLDMEALALASTGNCPDCYQLGASVWPEFSVWHIDDAPWHSLYNQHDLEKAKALLAESSYNGEEFEIVSISFYGPYANASRELVDQLTAMGINAKISEYGDMGVYGARFTDDPDKPRMAFFWIHLLTPILISPEWLTSVWACEPTITWTPLYCSNEMETILGDLITSGTVEEKRQALEAWEGLIYEDALGFATHAIAKPMFARNDIMGIGSWYTNRFHGVWRAQPPQ
jgi:peptide/nickel transport system substrate-binding protein